MSTGRWQEPSETTYHLASAPTRARTILSLESPHSMRPLKRGQGPHPKSHGVEVILPGPYELVFSRPRCKSAPDRLYFPPLDSSDTRCLIQLCIKPERNDASPLLLYLNRDSCESIRGGFASWAGIFRSPPSVSECREHFESSHAQERFDDLCWQVLSGGTTMFSPETQTLTTKRPDGTQDQHKMKISKARFLGKPLHRVELSWKLLGATTTNSWRPWG